MPGVARATSVKRRASVPYCSMSSRGLTSFPLVFDILSPFSSRTSPLMKTVRKGTSPAKRMPSMIMRATQKKMMSKPVIITSFG